VSRLLVVERDDKELGLWLYWLEDAGPDSAGRLRHDPLTHTGERLSAEPLYADPLYVTAALLVRQDCTRPRIVYDLDPLPSPRAELGGMSVKPGTQRTLAPRGETLAERADRERRPT